MIHCPEVDTDMRKSFEARDTPRELAKPPTKKKNKPMSKSEQEQKIELLKSREREFANRQGSGSQEPVMPSKFLCRRNIFPSTDLLQRWKPKIPSPVGMRILIQRRNNRINRIVYSVLKNLRYISSASPPQSPFRL